MNSTSQVALWLRGRWGTQRFVTLAVAVGLVAQPCFGARAEGARTAHALSGLWWASSYRVHIAPLDGTAIPFTAQGMARYRQNQAALEHGPTADAAQAACVPQGIPRALGAPYPFRLYQSGNQVVFIFEANRAFRIVLMTNRHADPAVWDPSYMGDGIGHVDNGQLVIDTTNFNAKTWLDDSGLPHSDHLRTLERLRTLESGRELEDVVTIEDPATFTRAWSVRFLFKRRPDINLSTDWVCGEQHRDITHVSGAKSYR